MKNKFELRILSKIVCPANGLVVLHGEWLGGRVGRNSCVLLVKGEKIYPLHIVAVVLGNSPGQLALACGYAQESSRLASKDDMLVEEQICRNESTVRTTALLGRMTPKQEDAFWAARTERYLAATQLLELSLFKFTTSI